VTTSGCARETCRENQEGLGAWRIERGSLFLRREISFSQKRDLSFDLSFDLSCSLLSRVLSLSLLLSRVVAIWRAVLAKHCGRLEEERDNVGDWARGVGHKHNVAFKPHELSACGLCGGSNAQQSSLLDGVRGGGCGGGRRRYGDGAVWEILRATLWVALHTCHMSHVTCV